MAAERRIGMGNRSVARAVVALISLIAVGSGGCGSGGDPYDALSNEAAEYVIPGSDGWTSGELCVDGGDCSGPITVSVVERSDWYRISGLTAGRDASPKGSATVTLEVEEARSAADIKGRTVAVRGWGPDLDEVKAVLAEGFEVWAGVDTANDHVVVFTAFDAEGRVAGIGHAAAEYFTVPVAELAADSRARTGFGYLDPLMVR